MIGDMALAAETAMSFPFLRLPPEIRDKIFRCCLVDYDQENPNKWFEWPQTYSYPPLLAIRRVCRQFRTETLQWLYSNTMRFYSIDKFLDFVDVTPPHICLLRLTIHLSGSADFVVVQDLAEDLALCLHSMPGLEDLRIANPAFLESNLLLHEQNSLISALENLSRLRVLVVLALGTTISIQVLKNKPRLESLHLHGGMSYPSNSPGDAEYQIFKSLGSLRRLRLTEIDNAQFSPHAIMAFVPLDEFGWIDDDQTGTTGH